VEQRKKPMQFLKTKIKKIIKTKREHFRRIILVIGLLRRIILGLGNFSRVAEFKIGSMKWLAVYLQHLL